LIDQHKIEERIRTLVHKGEITGQSRKIIACVAEDELHRVRMVELQCDSYRTGHHSAAYACASAKNIDRLTSCSVKDHHTRVIDGRRRKG